MRTDGEFGVLLERERGGGTPATSPPHRGVPMMQQVRCMFSIRLRMRQAERYLDTAVYPIARPCRRCEGISACCSAQRNGLVLV